MFRWQTLVGVALGLALGSAILALTGTPQRKPAPSGPVLSECSGHLREIVLQYEPAAKEIVAPVYRDFLAGLDDDVAVYIVCPDRAAFEDFRSTICPAKIRVSPIVVYHPMTTWSRDRWVALTPASPAAPTTLLSPRGEAGQEVWPARAGDQRMGQDIATAMAPSVLARRSELYFDGGDFLADNENVFVIPRVLPRNIQQTVTSRAQFLRIVAGEMKRKVVLLEEAPDHHAGMFMASVGNKRMLVGDPSLALDFFAEDGFDCRSNPANEFMHLPGGADFRPETQRLFDAVARQCSEAGYKVVRIPVVPAHDSRTYLTYVNVVLDQQANLRIVYLPFYRGVEHLNAAARKIWQELGYEVRPVDCTTAYRHFGCLHCLVNVLRRS